MLGHDAPRLIDSCHLPGYPCSPKEVGARAPHPELQSRANGSQNDALRLAGGSVAPRTPRSRGVSFVLRGRTNTVNERT